MKEPKDFLKKIKQLREAIYAAEISIVKNKALIKMFEGKLRHSWPHKVGDYVLLHDRKNKNSLEPATEIEAVGRLLYTSHISLERQSLL